MEVKNYKIKDLKPAEYNPRKISSEAMSQLKKSLEKFESVEPAVVNINPERLNVIVGGHQRIKAAKALKWKEFPCVEVDLSIEDEKELNVRLNKNTGEFDFELLETNFDVEDLEEWGFDPDELNFALNEEPEEVEGEDDVPEVPAVPITVRGDVWILGEHRLMCGDSTDAGSVALLMDGQKADMVFTDPPYLMDFTGGIHAEKEGDEFLDKINQIIKDFVEGAFYITFYRLGISQYLKSMERVGLKNRSLIIWHKGNHTLSNSDYMSMYEPMFYGWVNTHKFYGGKNGRDIWEIKRTAKSDLHPTMKPVELCQKAIEDASGKHQYVLDLFLGSGSTLIAAHKTGRKCYGMELDPKYCDVIIKRWEEFTGEEAVHECGKTFTELSQERTAGDDSSD